AASRCFARPPADPFAYLLSRLPGARRGRRIARTSECRERSGRAAPRTFRQGEDRIALRGPVALLRGALSPAFLLAGNNLSFTMRANPGPAIRKLRQPQARLYLCYLVIP